MGDNTAIVVAILAIVAVVAYAVYDHNKKPSTSVQVVREVKEVVRDTPDYYPFIYPGGYYPYYRTGYNWKGKNHCGGCRS